jgi:hypothetical protein
MYAQLIESVTTPERIDELGRSIRCELVTALRGQPGFSGVFSLLDRETGRSLLVILWETDEEASRPLVACDVPPLGTSPPTVWEVCGRG